MYMHVKELMKEDIHLKKNKKVLKGLEGGNGKGKECNHIIISKIEEKERQQLILCFVIKLVTPEQKTQRISRAKPTLYGYSYSKPTGI